MEEKEIKILESAREYFFRYGYKKTSMDDIAEAAGVAKGSLYNYFKNKEDLFIQTAECKRLESAKRLNEAAIPASRADEKLISLTLYMLQDVHNMVKQYAMSKAVLEELMIVGMDLMGDSHEHIEQAAEILQEGIDQGVLKPGDNMKRAATLIQINKMFFLRWANMDIQEAETEIREVHELILEGLRK